MGGSHLLFPCEGGCCERVSKCSLSRHQDESPSHVGCGGSVRKLTTGLHEKGVLAMISPQCICKHYYIG
jgi:hypothetical protein